MTLHLHNVINFSKLFPITSIILFLCFLLASPGAFQLRCTTVINSWIPLKHWHWGIKLQPSFVQHNINCFHSYSLNGPHSNWRQRESRYYNLYFRGQGLEPQKLIDLFLKVVQPVSGKAQSRFWDLLPVSETSQLQRTICCVFYFLTLSCRHNAYLLISGILFDFSFLIGNVFDETNDKIVCHHNATKHSY